MLAIYCLVLLYHGLENDLENINPLSKLLTNNVQEDIHLPLTYKPPGKLNICL
jgi:hypothetical protein